MAKQKKIQVLQNAWNILQNNGLGDCNVKYMGGLSFLFEWSSKEVAAESLLANNVWPHEWFDNVKMWENDGLSFGRLTWLVIDGLPALRRNFAFVKSMVKELGKILEIGRLYVDSKLLLPIKCLVFMSNIMDICQNPTIMLNGRSYSIRISEEKFNVSNLSLRPFVGIFMLMIWCLKKGSSVLQSRMLVAGIPQVAKVQEVRKMKRSHQFVPLVLALRYRAMTML